MIKTTRQFVGSDRERYAYDFGLCNSKDDWAQVDTTEDAPWFGQWANPFERQIVSYAEGDQTRIECDTDAEFIAELDRIAAFHRDKDQWKGIDDTWNERVSQRFIAAGAAHLLYTTTGTSPFVVIDGTDRQTPELVVCPRKDFTLASRGRRLAETPYFQGDSGRERYRATEVELQTCSSDTPLVAQLLGND